MLLLYCKSLNTYRLLENEKSLSWRYTSLEIFTYLHFKQLLGSFYFTVKILMIILYCYCNVYELKHRKCNLGFQPTIGLLKRLLIKENNAIV